MKGLGIVIIALFVFMTLIGSYQIVTRYFFNKPSTVSEAVSYTHLDVYKRQVAGKQEAEADGAQGRNPYFQQTVWRIEKH